MPDGGPARTGGYRQDALARLTDGLRWPGSVLDRPAEELGRRGESPVTGRMVTRGLLAHYTTWDVVEFVSRRGGMGGEGGCCVTSTVDTG